MTIKPPGELFCYLCDAVKPEQCICIKKPAIVGMIDKAFEENRAINETQKALNETHVKIKTAVAKRNEEENRRTWNAAIEAAAIVCADIISRDAVRMLKK